MVRVRYGALVRHAPKIELKYGTMVRYGSRYEVRSTLILNVPYCTAILAADTYQAIAVALINLSLREKLELY